MKFYHGETYSFQIESSKDLGNLTVAQIYWSYDDEVTLFDFSKVCLMFICSKHLYTKRVDVKSTFVSESQR